VAPGRSGSCWWTITPWSGRDSGAFSRTIPRSRCSAKRANALDAGVKGYILKNAIETDLTRAVRAVANGEQYLSPELSGVLIRAIQTGSFESSNDPYDKLTQREKQILQLIAHGKSNKEIAVLLDLSVNTVAVHRANLMSTLGVHKTAELVLFAVKKGLVLPE
jgi:DNA-binding NarL/FixJ family response regulator